MNGKNLFITLHASLSGKLYEPNELKYFRRNIGFDSSQYDCKRTQHTQNKFLIRRKTLIYKFPHYIEICFARNAPGWHFITDSITFWGNSKQFCSKHQINKKKLSFFLVDSFSIRIKCIK